MGPNKQKYFLRTVVSRLTFWYTIICVAFCITIVSVVSMKMSSNARKRVDQSLTTELTEFAGIYEQKGVQGLQEEFDLEAQANGENNLFCRLLSSQRQPVASSAMSGWASLEKELSSLQAPASNTPVLVSIHAEKSPLNARIASAQTPDGKVLQIGRNLYADNHFQEKIHRILFTSSLLMILLSTVSGWLIAKRAMSGVQRVTLAVSKIRRDRLNQKVPFGTEGDEIEQLVEAFNGMIERIGTLVRELKEVTDNVAHDLRSPITRMRGAAETTLTGPQEIEYYREMGQTIIEESERLTQMINTALEIAQAESGLLELKREPTDLTAILKNAADLFMPVAEEKQITLRANLPDDPLILFGDKSRLQRTIANLLDNAIKYTPLGGQITLAAFTHGQLIRIEISDTGIGIAPDETDHVFERFYRSEKSRSSQGNGLGLSLCKTIIQAHGGCITVKSQPGNGSTFTATLPHNQNQS
jgi:heavy metal sensor kinase